MDIEDVEVLSYLDTIAANGVFKYWDFNEVGGTTLASTPAGASLTRTSGVTPLGPRLAEGTSQEFDGTSALSGAYDSSLNPGTGLFSMECWISTTDTAQDAALMVRRQTAPPYSQQGLRVGSLDASAASSSSKRISFMMLGDGGGTERVWFTSATDVIDGNLHHIVAVRTGGRTAKLYVDGVEVALTTTGGTGAGTISITPTSAPTEFGQASGGSRFTGVMDVPAYYNVALSAGQVMENYLAGLASNLAETILALEPVGYWKLDDNGTSFVDSSGHERNGSGTNITDRDLVGADGASYAKFNPTSFSRVTVPDDDDFSVGVDGMTIFCLARPGTLAASQALITKGFETGYTNLEWGVVTPASGSTTELGAYTYTVGPITAVRTSLTSDTFQEVGTWQAIVITFDGPASTDPINFQKNGGALATTTQTPGAGSVTGLAAALQIGGRLEDPTWSYNGHLAHVAIFPRALLPDEALELAVAASKDGWIAYPSLGATLASFSPLAYLPLNDASGNFADLGSRGVDATPYSITDYRAAVGPDGDSYVKLDGVADKIQLPDAADLGITNAVGKTFVMAFKADAWAGYSALFAKYGTTAGSRDYGLWSTGATNDFATRRSQDASVDTHSAYNLDPDPAAGVWNTLITRFNIDGSATFFLNSPTATVESIATAPTGTAEQDGTGPFDIGAITAYPANYWFDGALAHFTIYDEELSDEACETIMLSAIAEGWTP